MESIKIESGKDVLRIDLQNHKGKSSGLYWQFDLEDIELPLRISNMFRDLNKNEMEIRAKIIAIDKKEDAKYDDLMTVNEREKILAMKEYYDKQTVALNNVLGENGVENFLAVQNRKPYFTMHYDIAEHLEKITPMLENNLKTVSDTIKEKYGEKKTDVLE